MGQWWKLLNLDSRRFIEYGKFEDGPIIGFHNLLVATATWEFDTLEAMRQRCEKDVAKAISNDDYYYEFFGISGMKQQRARNRWYNELYVHRTNHHVTQLIVLTGRTRKYHVDYPFFLPDQNPQAGCPLVVKLPPELLCCVADFLLGMRRTPIADCVALAMTCQTVYAIVRPRLNKKLAHGYKSWAGDRLICVGDNGYIGDLPSNVLSQAEIDEYGLSIESTKEEKSDDSNRNILYYTPDAADGWFDAHSRADDWEEALIVPRSKIAYEERGNCIDRPLLNLFNYTSNTKRAPRQPIDPDSILVVRNLTKREYIRGDVAEDRACQPPYNDNDTIEQAAYELGEVAFYAMMWSTYPAFRWRDQPAELKDVLYRGSWAGHRIDVVYVEEDKFAVELDGWTDVTGAFLDVAFGVLSGS